MKEQIDALSAQQAQRALLLFYDLLPEGFWEDGQKLAPADIDAWASEIQRCASGPDRALLENLRDPGSAPSRAELARDLLAYFAQVPPLAPYVEQAVARTREPQMLPIPALIVPLITVLLSMQFELDISSKTDGEHEERHTHIAIKPNPSVEKLNDTLNRILQAFHIGAKGTGDAAQ